MTKRISRRLGRAALAGALALAAGTGARAQEMEIGMRDFMLRCAACHGPRAAGDGPLAELLTSKPRDLRTLAAENDGVFPFVEVFQAIDGTREVGGHGTREMPVWGDYFREEALGGGLPLGVDSRQIVQGRILALVYYLQAIQQR